MLKILPLIFLFLLNGAIVFSQSGLLVPQNDIDIFDGGQPKSWEGGINSAQFNLIDLDLDGVNELIVLDRNAEQIHVFSKFNGQFIPDPNLIHLLPPLDRNWIITADYDCDGDQDIFNYGQSGIVVFQNNLSVDGEWIKVADPLFTVGFSGKINLLVNTADLPAILDIDRDGDVDILSYNFALGEDIYFHQNMSVENTGSCGELDFVITDREWGSFKECSCHEYAFGNQTCADVSNGRVAHTSGKALLAYDMNGDNDIDIFLSHSDCNDQVFFENEGDEQSPLFTTYLTPFPNDQEAVSFPIYPSVKMLDLDGDSIDEMYAAPNIDLNYEFTSDFSASLWKYENVGTTSSPVFKLTQKDFLQKGILDLGELSFPVFCDVDGDGDQDLLVASNDKKIESAHYGRIALLENTGNKFTPQFSIVDEDYLNLSEIRIHAPVIRVVDFNMDGTKDLFYSGYSWDQGKVLSFIFYNQANPGQPFKFNSENFNQVQLPTRILEVPEFIDVTGDGELDLIVGEKNGSMALYENKGNFMFEILENDYLGHGRDFSGVRVNVHPFVTDYNLDGKMDLMVADTKDVTVYFDFVNSSNSKAEVLRFFNSFVQAEDSISMQKYNSLASADLYRTGFREMILGGSGGGLRFFRQKMEIDNPDFVGNDLLIYPNPSFMGRDVAVESVKGGLLTIYNIKGQKVVEAILSEKSANYIKIATFASGVYLLKFISSDGHYSTSKLMIRR